MGSAVIFRRRLICSLSSLRFLLSATLTWRGNARRRRLSIACQGCRCLTEKKTGFDRKSNDAPTLHFENENTILILKSETKKIYPAKRRTRISTSEADVPACAPGRMKRETKKLQRNTMKNIRLSRLPSPLFSVVGLYTSMLAFFSL